MDKIPDYEIIEQFNSEGVDRNEKTRKWYFYLIGRYHQFLDNEGSPLHLTDASHVKRFLAHLREQEYSWSVRNGTHTALNVFYQWLVKRERIERNPFEVEEIKRPRKPRKIHQLPTLTSVQIVVNELRRDGSHLACRDLAILLIMLDGGLRRAETVDLNIGSLDLGTGRVAVVGKGENERWSQVEADTIKAVQDWLIYHPHNQPKNPLFTTVRGQQWKRLSPRMVNEQLQRWSIKAGLTDHLKPHDLRRLFATHFSQSGGGSKILQELMGHKNLETTEGYIITTDDEIRRQHRRHSPVNLLNL